MNKYMAIATNDSGAVLIEFLGNNKKDLEKTIRGMYAAPFKIVIYNNLKEAIETEVQVKR